MSQIVDLVDSIPYKTRWGPSVGKVVLEVAFTHPIRRGVECCPVGERPFWQKKILQPENSDPVPGVQMPSIFYLHSVHNVQVLIAVVRSWEMLQWEFQNKETKNQRPTCVDKLDDWMELWKKERGGRGRAEHRATELGRHWLERRAWIEIENYFLNLMIWL